MIELEEHLVTLFEPSTQRVVPDTPGVVRPLTVKKLPVPVLMTTLLLPVGVKIDSPLATSPELKVPVELKVAAPVTPRIPPRVVLPVPTVRLLEPVTDVLPLRLMLPEPVLNVPVPD